VTLAAAGDPRDRRSTPVSAVWSRRPGRRSTAPRPGQAIGRPVRHG